MDSPRYPRHSISTVNYRPVGPGTGSAYLGVTPRTYFDNERSSASIDVAREAAGLAAWWRLVRGEGDDVQRAEKESELAAYLAPDDVGLDDDGDWDDEDDDEDLDDGDVFVEVMTGRFLAALDLPLPADLRR